MMLTPRHWGARIVSWTPGISFVFPGGCGEALESASVDGDRPESFVAALEEEVVAVG